MGEDAASVDQQLVREHGKVAIVGGRAAGITAAAALAKAAPALQKIDLFEARGLKRTSALLNRVGAFVIIEADQNLNRNAIVTKIGVPFDGDVPTTGPVRFAGEAPLTEMRSSPRTRRRDRGNFLRVTRFSRTSRTNPFWRNVKRVTLEAYHRGISLLPRRPRVRNNRGCNSEIRQMPPKRD